MSNQELIRSPRLLGSYAYANRARLGTGTLRIHICDTGASQIRTAYKQRVGRLHMVKPLSYQSERVTALPHMTQAWKLTKHLDRQRDSPTVQHRFSRRGQ